LKVLLVNPPAPEIVIRDYYCSKSTKSNYLFQPIDLLMQSGVLAKDHEVVAIDAVAARLGADECMARIERHSPDAVLGLWGAVTDSVDHAFYKSLSNEFSAPIFITGEVLLEDPEAWLTDRPFIKGALLRFVSTGLSDYLLSGEPGADLMVGGGGPVSGGFDPDPPGEFSLGRPRHELFGHDGYHFSFARGRKFATVLTDFGCPFKCGFCVMSGLGYRTRPIGEVIDELRWLKGRGITELFVTDQCFGARRERTVELCEAVAEDAAGMSFTTFTRADLLDGDVVAVMKRAGLHTAIMGVESADGETLAGYHKGLSMDKVRRGFALCREHGVRTVATFIIGLPEDDENSIRATMRLARELDPDFVSYNVAVPRATTTLRRVAREEGLADPGADFDQAGDVVAMRTRSLGREQVARLKRLAVRDFYIRPGYLFRRLSAAGSVRQLLAEAREGVSLLIKNI